jgi:hypothetical protein
MTHESSCARVWCGASEELLLALQLIQVLQDLRKGALLCIGGEGVCHMLCLEPQLMQLLLY